MENPEESAWYQAEFEQLGEFPVIPQPQWEKIQEAIITDTTETSSVYRSAFQEDLVDGFI